MSTRKRGKRDGSRTGRPGARSLADSVLVVEGDPVVRTLFSAEGDTLDERIVAVTKRIRLRVKQAFILERSPGRSGGITGTA